MSGRARDDNSSGVSSRCGDPDEDPDGPASEPYASFYSSGQDEAWREDTLRWLDGGQRYGRDDEDWLEAELGPESSSAASAS